MHFGQHSLQVVLHVESNVTLAVALVWFVSANRLAAELVVLLAVELVAAPEVAPCIEFLITEVESE